jgi:hypothetical protein
LSSGSGSTFGPLTAAVFSMVWSEAPFPTLATISTVRLSPLASAPSWHVIVGAAVVLQPASSET